MVQKEIHFVLLKDIKIANGRFREVFSEQTLNELQESISVSPGLISPISLRKDLTLIAGETRLKAITILHDIGSPVFFNGIRVEEGFIPAIVPVDTLEEVDYLQMELNENTIRAGFTFLEETNAIAKIARIRQAIANEKNPPKSGAERIAEAKTKAPPLGIKLDTISKEVVRETAADISNGVVDPNSIRKVQETLRVAQALESNADLKKSLEKATNLKDANKIIKQHETAVLHTNLAIKVGKTFSTKNHNIIHGDCLVELPKLQAGYFDVCLTDPIYGINAGNFGDAAGKMASFSHKYDDSLETFKVVMPKALKMMEKCMKPAAHVYLACDLRNLYLLREMLEATSNPANPWKIPNAPFIQYKIAGGRVPHPGYTPRRSYEVWLYAYRGNKQELRLINDVIECTSDKTESHGAGKPKDLLKTFLTRSCLPGEKVLDFMAGSGSIITACHELNLTCTAVEISEEYYGRCIERLKELR